MLSSHNVEITSSSQRMLIRALFIATPASGTPLVSKFGNLSNREILVVTSGYVRTPVKTLGRGRGVPRQPDRGWGMPSFLGGKSRGAFGQPAFLLEGNCMSTVAFEKSFNSLFTKTIAQQN